MFLFNSRQKKEWSSLVCTQDPTSNKHLSIPPNDNHNHATSPSAASLALVIVLKPLDLGFLAMMFPVASLTENLEVTAATSGVFAAGTGVNPALVDIPPGRPSGVGYGRAEAVVFVKSRVEPTVSGNLIANGGVTTSSPSSSSSSRPSCFD